MFRIVNRLLISSALLISGGLVYAEEGLTENQTVTIQGQLKESEPSLKSEAGENASAVTNTELNLTAANALITQTGNTFMTAGTCLVIDEIFRQFCSANPNDVSCQFQ
jgi:hypothetical protein